MEKLLTRYHWLKLTNEQRILMREAFSIPKSGGVEMMGNQMLSDGSNEEDLKAVNVQTMQQFTEDESSDFDFLYIKTIKKIDDIIEAQSEAKADELHKEGVMKRKEEIDQVVDTILETITNLPMDAQVKIKNILSDSLKENTKKETDDTKTTKAKKVK